MKKDTLLLRQVHKSWIVGDTISSLVFTSQTFKPMPKDEGKLSVYHGDKFDAEKSFSHFTQQGFSSEGVVAVSKQECDTENLPVIEDNAPFDGHCSIDYTALSPNGVKKTAGILKDYARQRGWLYKTNKP